MTPVREGRGGAARRPVDGLAGLRRAPACPDARFPAPNPGHPTRAPAKGRATSASVYTLHAFLLQDYRAYVENSSSGNYI